MDDTTKIQAKLPMLTLKHAHKGLEQNSKQGNFMSLPKIQAGASFDTYTQQINKNAKSQFTFGISQTNSIRNSHRVNIKPQQHKVAFRPK